jgi:tetratricopeptide (TPR) repeat protein
VSEATAEFREAMRLDPNHNSHFELGVHLFLNGQVDGAISEVRQAVSIDFSDNKSPFGGGNLHVVLGYLLQSKGDLHAAFDEFRQAFILSQDCCYSHDLRFIASFLNLTGKLEDEIEVFRARLRSHPDDTYTITQLADIFRSQGKLDEEIALYREAIRLKPQAPKIHGLFARVLRRQGRPDEAKVESDREIALYREMIRKNPGDAEARQDFAEALFDQGMWNEGLKELREVIRIAPSSNPFGTVGSAFYSGGKVEQAIALYREAIRLKPADADAHNNLGYCLLDFGEVTTSLTEIREALRLEPKNPICLDTLGRAHLARGEIKEALAALREAIHLLKERPDSDILSYLRHVEPHLRHVERLSALEGRFDAILRGQDVPTDVGGLLDIAELCRVTRRFAIAARFYREAFQAKPALADDLDSRHRLRAAIAAAQVGTSPNQDKDSPPVDDAGRARWRAQALAWLRAEKDACAKVVEAETVGQPKADRPPNDGAQKLPLARRTLDILAHHRDLACVRDGSRLKGLPPQERPAWQAFWAEIDALRKRAQGDRP